MPVRSGIEPLDASLEGLKEGGLHLISGAPGSGRLVALLQFLLAEPGDGPVGIVTAAPPARIFDEGAYWGFPVEEAWRSRRLHILTLREDFERRLTAAAEPDDVYREMAELLGPSLPRLALYPGTPLWDTPAGTSVARRFLKWIRAYGATTLGTIGSTADRAISPATSWVLESASGIFLLEVESNGLRKLSIQRASPAPRNPRPILLALARSGGLDAATEEPESPEPAEAGAQARTLLLVNLGGDVPDEANAWVRSHYEVHDVDDPLHAVESIQQDPGRFGVILLHPNGQELRIATRTCRALRHLTGAPILLFTDQAIRANDRVRAIRSGASEFLTAPLNVAELATHLEHAIIAGGRKPARESGSADPGGEGDGSIPSTGDFRKEVEERLAGPTSALFTFLHFQPAGETRARVPLQERLLRTIRAEDGDFVGILPDGVGVILDGCPVQAAGAFVDRLRSGLDPAGFTWRVMSGSTDADEIRRILDAAAPAESPGPALRLSGAGAFGGPAAGA